MVARATASNTPYSPIKSLFKREADKTRRSPNLYDLDTQVPLVIKNTGSETHVATFEHENQVITIS